MAEIPVVIVNVQRVGPSALDNQQHRHKVMNASALGTHGDHSIIALLLWTVKECFDVTVLAVNYAE